MGLFDKFKDAALTVAKTATDKISSVMKDEESKTKEKYADDIPIQILPTLGIVFNYSGIDTMYSYDICLDDENERIVLRKESDEGPYKYKFIVGYDYNLFKKLQYINSEKLEVSAEATTLVHNFRLFANNSLYVDFGVCCCFPNDDSSRVVKYEMIKLFNFVYRFIDIITEENTKLCVNEFCRFYNLLPIFDDNGDINIDNAATNAADNPGFM